MSKRLFWVHEDALSMDHPMFERFQPGDAVCFVWDDEHLESMGYGFQRLVFVYETICEMGIQVYRGSTVRTLNDLAHAHEASVLCVPHSLNPALQQQMASLEQELTVEVVRSEPFASLDKAPNLRRFFAYWKLARPALMRP